MTTCRGTCGSGEPTRGGDCGTRRRPMPLPAVGLAASAGLSHWPLFEGISSASNVWIDSLRSEEACPVGTALVTPCLSRPVPLASVAPYSAAAFIASKPTTFAELMDPLERLSEQLGRPWGVVSHLKAGAYTCPLFGST